MEKIFVTGIGTDVGKTVVSAILVEALEADYWKPVQSGDVYNSDSFRVRELIGNQRSRFHPESYRLTRPLSPHAAARHDKVDIDLAKIQLPETDRPLVIEGAGGLLVPLNRDKLVIDLVARLGAPVVLVSRNYLGSINHTLLSIEALTARKIEVLGIVFNGRYDSDTEDYILDYSGLPLIGRIDPETEINSATIARYAGRFKEYLENRASLGKSARN